MGRVLFHANGRTPIVVFATVAGDHGGCCAQLFSTTGEKIVGAVMDSGIDALHPHFETWSNLDPTDLGLRHRDPTAPAGQPEDDNELAALADRYGHGTHVAGIIAGARTAAQGDIVARTRYRDEEGAVKEQTNSPPRFSGIAPRCKLLSLKGLDDEGNGRASSMIAGGRVWST